MPSEVKRCKKCGLVLFGEENTCPGCRSRTFVPIEWDEVAFADAVTYVKMVDDNAVYDRDKCLACLSDIVPDLVAERNALGIAFGCGAVKHLSSGDVPTALRLMKEAYLSDTASSMIATAYTGETETVQTDAATPATVKTRKDAPEMSEAAKEGELKLAEALVARGTLSALTDAIAILEGVGGFGNASELIEDAKAKAKPMQDLERLQGLCADPAFLAGDTVGCLTEALERLRPFDDLDGAKQVIKERLAGFRFRMGTWNGEEIVWRVLDVADKRILAVTDRAIDCKQYNESSCATSWADCTLRSWLNVEFLAGAFSASERTMIIETHIINDDNPGFGTLGGPDTKDRVFCLSIEEVHKYFADDDSRICYPTLCAKENGVWMDDDDGGACIWWLRSPGCNQNVAAYVRSGGNVYEIGGWVCNDNVGVRPALWLDL